MIIDGKIKLKNGTEIERFTPNGLKFKDGSELEADVVLYATGYAARVLSRVCSVNADRLFVCSFGDPRSVIRDIVGEEEGKKVVPIWSINVEGEVRGAWREIGLPNVWYMMGNLAWCRFFSKHVALRMSRILSPFVESCSDVIHHVHRN